MPSPDEYPPVTIPFGGELPKVEKYGHEVTVSRGELQSMDALRYSISGGEYQRRRDGYHTIEPTPEELAEYAEFKTHWDFVANSRFVTWNTEGLEEDGEPRPRQVPNYLETYDEWLARCRELDGKK